MEFILSLLVFLVDRFLGFLQLPRRKPRVTCDIRGVFEGRWSLDFLPEEYGANEDIQIDMPEVSSLAFALWRLDTLKYKAWKSGPGKSGDPT